ncbi:MAG: 4Fe-4S binding protein [Bacteroidales bacterium]|nr:4Fe-4S binding protein [Bacteroidales bacterium]MDZ4203675.1 4Fe-4S binding protein [Bacteroidales bacterium]
MINQIRQATQWFFRRVWFLLFFLFVALQGYAAALQTKGCAQECSFSGCNEAVSEGFTTGSDLFRLILLAGLFFLLAFYFYKKVKARKLYWAVTIVVAVSLSAAILYKSLQPNIEPEVCKITTNQTTGVLTDTAHISDFLPLNDDFEPLEKAEPDVAVSIVEGAGRQETSPDTSFVQSGNDFAPLDDEFASGEFQTIEDSSSVPENSDQSLSRADKKFLIELVILFTVLIIISFFIKNEAFRKFRGLFLLATVVYLGFIKGACPCMILSFQNLVLAGLGQQVAWISLIWFLALLPLTYFFGKIWCSWLCHLGGLQEFLFQADGLKILKSLKAQAFLRYFRIAVLVILIVQLIVTRTNIFIHYDPFKMAFNLFSANTAGYVLLVILLLLSVLIYRPFCRAFCPVGVALAWVSYLPGAKNITKTNSCTDCKRCSDVCKTHAIVYENGISRLNIHDCIFCGDCMGSCRKNSITIS